MQLHAATLRIAATAIVLGMAATRRPSRSRVATYTMRGHRLRNAATRRRAREPVGCQRDGQGHAQKACQGHAHQDRAHNHATDVEDQDRSRAYPNQHHGVDDPLHDHGPERRAAADSLPVTEVVTSDQLAQAGRQDVVGEVPDQHVGAEAAQRNAVDRGDQPLPAHCPEGQIGGHACDGETEPGGVGSTECLRGVAEIDAAQNQVDAHDRDDEADTAASDAGGQAPHRAVVFRPASFLERLTRRRCSMKRAMTRSVERP